MSSREAVKELYREREYLLGDKVHSKSKTWHNDIVHYDNINRCLLTIMKDLEILEILKKHIEINECNYDDKDQNCIDVLIPESNQCFKEIKEWLEDESR